MPGPTRQREVVEHRSPPGSDTEWGMGGFLERSAEVPLNTAPGQSGAHADRSGWPPDGAKPNPDWLVLRTPSAPVYARPLLERNPRSFFGGANHAPPPLRAQAPPPLRAGQRLRHHPRCSAASVPSHTRTRPRGQATSEGRMGQTVGGPRDGAVIARRRAGRSRACGTAKCNISNVLR